MPYHDGRITTLGGEKNYSLKKPITPYNEMLRNITTCYKITKMHTNRCTTNDLWLKTECEEIFGVIIDFTTSDPCFF